MVQPKQSTLVKNFLKPNHLGHNGFKTTISGISIILENNWIYVHEFQFFCFIRKWSVHQPTNKNIIFLPIKHVCESYSTQLKSQVREDSWGWFQRPLLQAGGEAKTQINGTNNMVENAAFPSHVTDTEIVLCLVWSRTASNRKHQELEWYCWLFSKVTNITLALTNQFNTNNTSMCFWKVLLWQIIFLYEC